MRTTGAFIVSLPKEVGLEGFKGDNPPLYGPLEAEGGSASPPARCGDMDLQVGCTVQLFFIMLVATPLMYSFTLKSHAYPRVLPSRFVSLL